MSKSAANLWTCSGRRVYCMTRKPPSWSGDVLQHHSQDGACVHLPPATSTTCKLGTTVCLWFISALLNPLRNTVRVVIEPLPRHGQLREQSRKQALRAQQTQTDRQDEYRQLRPHSRASVGLDLP